MDFSVLVYSGLMSLLNKNQLEREIPKYFFTDKNESKTFS